MSTAEILSTIITEFPYALAGSILVGALCGFLGVYIVAKRVVFLGAVLTQVSVLGIAVTFLPFLHFLNHTAGSLLVTLLTVIIVARFLTGKKIPRDAMLGFVFVSSIAVRVLLLQKAPKVEAAEIDNLLRGDILFVTPELLYVMAGIAVAAWIVHLLFFKEFSYIAFDPETAITQGYKAVFWETLFYVIAAVVIAVATHVVGDIFVFGFLIVPAITSMLVTKRVGRIFLYSTLLGAILPVFGLILAFQFDYPASPAMVGIACAVTAAAYGVSLIRRR